MPKYQMYPERVVAVDWNGATSGMAISTSAAAVEAAFVIAAALFAMADPERRVENKEMPCDKWIFLEYPSMMYEPAALGPVIATAEPLAVLVPTI